MGFWDWRGELFFMLRLEQNKIIYLQLNAEKVKSSDESNCIGFDRGCRSTEVKHLL